MSSRELPSPSLSDGGVGEGGDLGEVGSPGECFTAPVLALAGTGNIELTSTAQNFVYI